MSINTNDLSDLHEINLFEQAVQSFFEGHIDADRFTATRLQMGVYGQRQEGVNMLRVKVPGGRIVPEQLEALADVTETYSQKGYANITTRQSIQIHHIPLAQTPDAMRRLAQAGLTTREACSNTVRNMTACPLAGVCPREHVDVGTHVDGATQHFLRNPLTQQMPRKFKISFSGCEADCAQSLLQDAGVVAVVKDGQQGFRVKAGGGLGHKPHEAIVVEEFIPERELLFALEALVTLHNKYSNRTMRAKSRIKFLVERFGADGFREKYREEFTRTKDALADKPYPQGAWRAASDVAAPGPGAPRKLFAQHQAGLFVLPLTVPLGELDAAQLRGVAAALRAHGLDEAHTTQDQNLAITNVPSEKVGALRAAFAELGLREPVTGDNVVACPGTSTCRLGITSSTIVAPKLSGGLKDISIRVSGCHNGCAQPETGDIGIYGEGKRLFGRLVPHYQTYFGGSGVANGALAVKGPAVPAARVKQAIERVQKAHADSGEASFFAWARKQDSDYFERLLADIVEVKQADSESVMRDHGEAGDFRVVNLGGGECAGASQVLIGANFFEAAHERDYRNALMFQRKFVEAAQCNESILRILGSGLAQLLGGIRQDDLNKLAIQLGQLSAGEIADEFARLVAALAGQAEVSDVTLAPLNRALDTWTVKLATFCVAQDEGLDLNEALPEGVAP
ncbi:MAG: nitrite/sulfite reductase [Nitrosomonadales bacterium]|nr:nitrite/sulfite reductase [Nitrosomonadales bacterium]